MAELHPDRQLLSGEANQPVPTAAGHESPPEQVVISCEHVISQLGDYVSEELPLQERDQMEWHLSSCPSCSRQAEEYVAVIRAAGTQDMFLPSPGVESRLKKFISRTLK